MTKHYAFFLKPDGRKVPRGEESSGPVELLRSLVRRRFVYRGSLPLYSFEESHLQSVLPLLIVIEIDGAYLNAVESERLVAESVRDVVEADPSTKSSLTKSLLNSIDKRVAAYLRKPVEGYLFVSSIVVNEFDFDTIEVDGLTIRRRSVRRDMGELKSSINRCPNALEIMAFYEKHEDSEIEIEIAGRSESEALSRSIRALNVLRALWNLESTTGQKWDSSSHLKHRCSAIEIGPIHTIYKNGKQCDRFCYEPDFLKRPNKESNPERWRIVQSNARLSLETLKQLSPKLRRELSSLLVRYVEALDCRDKSIAHLKMWSVLESLTGSIGSQYEKVVCRAARIQPRPHRAYYEELLGISRLHRNRYVHSGEEQSMFYQVQFLKDNVDSHLHFLLSRTFGFKDLSAYGRFLDSPKTEELNKRKSSLEEMIRLDQELDEFAMDGLIGEAERFTSWAARQLASCVVEFQNKVDGSDVAEVESSIESLKQALALRDQLRIEHATSGLKLSIKKLEKYYQKPEC